MQKRGISRGFSFLFDGILSPYESDEDHDDCYDEEDVNESAYGVGSDEAEKPKDQKDDSNGG